VTDPLAFTGCGRNGRGPEDVPELVKDGDEIAAPGEKSDEKTPTNGHSAARKLVVGLAPPFSRNGIARAMPWSERPVHPVTVWRAGSRSPSTL